MNSRPPKWAMRFFRWYCRKDLADAIEGDLLELYQRRLQKYGKRKSDSLFLWNVIIFCQPFAFKPENSRTQNSSIMLKNHFKIAFRLMRRQRSLAFTNIFGLAIGITASLFLLLYVSYELSFDSFHKDAGRIYAVNAISFNPEGNFYRQSAPSPLTDLMASDFPEVEAATRITSTRFPDNLIKANNKEFFESFVAMGDEGFFDVFSFDLIAGNPETALNEPGKVIMTRKTAMKYFGTIDIIGKTVNYENSFELQVTGVLEDIPSNSTLQFSFIISNRTQGLLYKNWITHWGSSNARIFVKVREGFNPRLTGEKFPEIVEQYIRDDLDKGEEYVLSLQQITDIHLNPHVAPERKSASSNKKYTYILPIVGFFILLIAGFNYVNLTTARMSERLKEVGVRKVVGSTRQGLRAQFLVESITTVMIALLLSIGLLILLMNPFNELTGKGIELSELLNVDFLTTALLIVVTLGLASGLYPALVLSKIRPINALKQGFSNFSGGKTNLRGALLIIQFAVAFIMITATMVINQQMNYLQETPLGFDKEQVIYFRQADRNFWRGADALKAELQKNPRIEAVAFSSGIPGNPGFGSTAKLDDGARELEIRHIMLDKEYIDLYKFEVIEGRSFDYDLATDKSAAYLINETAVRQIGWDEPLGETLELWGKKGQVIGVLKDFHFESMKNPIGPMAFHISESNYRVVSMKLGTDEIAETIQFIEGQWATMMPDRPFQFQFLDARFEDYYREEQRFSGIMDIATTLGLVLAISGLFSLTAFLINKRAKEISIRKVLGASYASVMRLFLNKMIWIGLVATIVAIPLAYTMLNQWLGGFAYHIDMSIINFAIVTVIMMLIIIFTVGAQVTRSVGKNPVDNLRHE